MCSEKENLFPHLHPTSPHFYLILYILYKNHTCLWLYSTEEEQRVGVRIIPYKKLIMSEYHLLMSLEGVWDCFLIFITVDTFIMILSNKETRMITISAWVQQEKKKLQRRPSSW